MTGTIRNLRLDEYTPFMRFLNRAYALGPGAFERYYPHMYSPTPETCASAYVLVRDGEIVSHVGLYPIEVVVHGVSLPIGGIGGVATRQRDRGKGYMSRLLFHVIGEMRGQGYALSWLAGDRQRYNAFGWARSGIVYDLKMSRRALERADVRAVPLEEHVPGDVVDVVARYHVHAVCHTLRPNLDRQLTRAELRAWTAEDGYLLAEGHEYGPLAIRELISTSGRELGMVRSLLDWTERDEVSWALPGCDGERLARVLTGATHWRTCGWEMYRIVDLAELLSLMAPVLSQRSTALRDLELSIGVREHDRTDVATLSVCDGAVEVSAGRNADRYTEWSSVEAARLLLGGAPIAAEVDLPVGLAALLPLPVYVPPLDHV